MNLQVMEFDNNSDKLNEERSRAILFFCCGIFHDSWILNDVMHALATR